LIEILAVTAPIYITIALGFVAARIGVFSKSDARVLGRFVVHFGLPAMLFSALAVHPFGDIFNGRYLLAYGGGSLAIVAGGLLWCRRVAGFPALTATFCTMGMSCANSGFVGYPILLLALPSVAGIALAHNLIIENVVVIPMLLVLAEHTRADSGPLHRVTLRVLGRVALNPMIVAVGAGFATSLSGLSLPLPLARTVNLFGATSGALSLFAIGGALVGLPVRGLGHKIAPIVVGKLVAHPLAVLLAAFALPTFGLPPLEPALVAAAVLLAAMPMMGIFPVLAQAYRQGDYCAAALLVATIASFFTLSVALWAIARGPIPGAG